MVWKGEEEEEAKAWCPLDWRRWHGAEGGRDRGRRPGGEGGKGQADAVERA